MNILITLWRFAGLTGSELYTYELATRLAARGHRVTVAAPAVGGEIALRAQVSGVTIAHRDAAAGQAFDILHLQQPEPAAWALQRFPGVPAVMTVHGRIEPFERPVVDARIHHYICVLPEFQDRAVYKYGLPVDKTSVIYNPIDRNRFNTAGARDGDPPVLLMVGTMNDIRAAMFQPLQVMATRAGMQLVIIGGHMGTWNIEDHVKRARAVAGLYLGRAIIEGWCCGKTALAFHYDDRGAITGDPAWLPPPADLTVFDAERVTDQTVGVYENALCSAAEGARSGAISEKVL